MGRAYGCFLTLVFGGILLSQTIGFAAVSVPLYEADDIVGYWPKRSQRGAAYLVNDWAFNSDSMGVAEEFKPSERSDVLLVGDSIVDGGNRVPQSDKIASLLERKTGWQVWPISAGSWALQNELAFLRRKARVVQSVDRIVFVFNSEDFGEPSSWSSEFTHPRRVPIIPFAYLIGKFWLGAPPETPPELRVEPRNVESDWQAFRASVSMPVTVIGVPKRGEQGCPWMPAWIGPHTCADLGPDDYDDEFHPDASGRAKLVGLIAQ